MNRALRPYLIGFVLLAAVADLRAQIAGPVETTRGKVLLLDNDRILEGDIEKIDGQYRIRRTVGELWVDARRAKRLCKDVDEAYEVMKRQINLKDADERLRLSRWCHSNGLKPHALFEAKIALDMRPDHLETVRMVQMLQRLAVATHPALTQPPPAPPPVKAAPRPAGASAIDVSTESFAVFATRVQPILMNTCVSCHSQGKGGNFHLVRATEGNSRAAAQTNLSAVLEFVNVDKTVLSPLLIKSLVAHGGAASSPLKGRQSAAFQTMQTWVDETLAANPHIREIRQAEMQMGMPTTSAKKEYGGEPFASSDRPALPPLTTQPLAQPKELKILPPQASPPRVGVPALAGSSIPAKAGPPTPPPSGPRDPFDPAEFNSRPK